jgi:hypothetical protein
MKHYFFPLFISLLLVPNLLSAQGDVYERSAEYDPPTQPEVISKLSHWQDQKFGVLFHWGLYAVPRHRRIVVDMQRRLDYPRHDTNLSTIQKSGTGDCATSSTP